ncbi:PLC-like phosphodiesterase [Astrocystis sublimbata]|nr:PLC-like phosphodiesterase [Astrocystis sublimbata]
MRSVTSLSLFALVAGAAADCNGKAEYCDRKYSQVTFAGSHNSGFVGIGPSDNQLTSVTAQLDQGIRFMTTQTHDKDGAIQMCHTSCDLLNAGPLQDYLNTVKTWVDGHPDDVVTLLITNQDAIDITKFDDAFKSAGLDSLAFVPSGQLGLDDWPTLGDMISSGNRVVVFMDYNSDTSKVPYILDEFAYYFETPFDPLEDKLSGCDIDRPAGASADGRLILANHNRNVEILGIDLPDLTHAGDTNSVSSISAQSDTCKGQHGRVPNVVLVSFFVCPTLQPPILILIALQLDYVSIGDAINAQTQLNGL